MRTLYLSPLFLFLSLSCALCFDVNILVVYTSHSFQLESARPCACYCPILFARRHLYGSDRILYLRKLFVAVRYPLLYPYYFLQFSISSFSILLIIERVFRAIVELYLCLKMTKHASGVSFKKSDDFRICDVNVCVSRRTARTERRRRLRRSIRRRRSNYKVNNHLFVMLFQNIAHKILCNVTHIKIFNKTFAIFHIYKVIKDINIEFFRYL